VTRLARAKIKLAFGFVSGTVKPMKNNAAPERRAEQMAHPAVHSTPENTTVSTVTAQPNMTTEYGQKSRDGAAAIFETTASWSVGEGKPKESKTGTFGGPALPTATVIIDYVRSLNPENVVKFFDSWFYGASLKCKASLRPAAAVDSPWIARAGVKIGGKVYDIQVNLATGERIDKKTSTKLEPLPIEKRLAAINNMLAEAASLGTEPGNAAVVARRMLLEAKQATETNGMLVVAK
jgi:hypothetical protein